MSTTQWQARLVMPVDDERDHVQGRSGAPLTLLEYGDYECPYCGAAYPIVQQLQAAMGEQLRFVFRNFPISTSHPHAEEAAEAAEAAGGQDRFWQMHDVLYENQRRLGHSDLYDHAQRVGLDADQFRRDFDGHVYAPRVHDDFLSGVRSGVNGTPTFYVNGLRHDDSYDFDTLLRALQRATVSQPTR